MRIPLAAALAAALGVLAPAAATLPTLAAAQAPAGATVKIDNFAFGPVALTVKAGTTVTWVNQDDAPHTVVSGNHATFKSKVLDTGESFAFTFTQPGEYPYFCSLHPHMVGKVVVQG